MNIKETINDLYEKRKQLKKELNKVNKAIDVLQEVCDHDNGDALEYDGHGHNSSCYKCNICKKEIWK